MCIFRYGPIIVDVLQILILKTYFKKGLKKGLFYRDFIKRTSNELFKPLIRQEAV